MPEYKFSKAQKLWLKNLREHPERQLKHLLGVKKVDEPYKACCLGEYLLCDFRVKKKKFPFKEADVFGKELLFDVDSTGFLSGSFERLKLYSSNGGFKDNKAMKFGPESKRYITLASMNDDEIPWPEIADIIEKHPDKIFTDYGKQ